LWRLTALATITAAGSDAQLQNQAFITLVDYNWDISTGCPSFLTDPPSHQIRRTPEKLRRHQDVRE
jgi:hypothetical protein